MSATRPSGGKKLLRRLVLGLGVVVVLVVASLSIVITNDQLRDAAAPEIDLAAVRLEAAPRARPSPMRSAANAGGQADGANESALLTEDRFWRYRPVLDVAALAPELREEARVWNRQADAFTTQLLTLMREAGALEHDEAWRRLDELDRAAHDAWDEHRERLSRELRKHDEWDRNFWLARYLIAAKNGEWQRAALSCFLLAYADSERRELWWEREVYCWRQLGARGRVLLARRSAERAIAPVARTLDEIGDAFYKKIGRDLEENVIGRLPGHEDWYGPVRPFEPVNP